MIKLAVTVTADTPEEEALITDVVYAMGRGLRDGLKGIADLSVEVKHG